MKDDLKIAAGRNLSFLFMNLEKPGGDSELMTIIKINRGFWHSTHHHARSLISFFISFGL